MVEEEEASSRQFLQVQAGSGSKVWFDGVAATQSHNIESTHPQLNKSCNGYPFICWLITMVLC